MDIHCYVAGPDFLEIFVKPLNSLVTMNRLQAFGSAAAAAAAAVPPAWAVFRQNSHVYSSVSGGER